MAEITGAVFNFKIGGGTGQTASGTSTADNPTDTDKPSAKVAGEKTSWATVKTAIGLNYAQRIAQTAVSGVISNLEGSQLSAQASALQGIATNVVSTAVSFAANPVVGAVNLATQAISYGFQQNKMDRQKAWSDYDLSEYRTNRGYSAAYNRSRSN
jgi:hypothetical protein